MPTVSYNPTTQAMKQGQYNNTVYTGTETYNIGWNKQNKRITKITFTYTFNSLPQWMCDQMNNASDSTILSFNKADGTYMCASWWMPTYSSTPITQYYVFTEDGSYGEAFVYIVNQLETTGNLTLKHIEPTPTNIYTSGSTKISRGYFNITAASMTIEYEYINSMSFGVNGTWKPSLIYYGNNGSWVQCKSYVGREAISPQQLTLTGDMFSKSSAQYLTTTDYIEVNGLTDISYTWPTATAYNRISRSDILLYDKDKTYLGYILAFQDTYAAGSAIKNILEDYKQDAYYIKLRFSVKSAYREVEAATLYADCGYTIQLDRKSGWVEAH